MKKALITGITGQDGSYLAEQAVAYVTKTQFLDSCLKSAGVTIFFLLFVIPARLKRESRTRHYSEHQLCLKWSAVKIEVT